MSLKMYQIPTTTILNGISAFAAFLTGMLCSIAFFIDFLRNRKKYLKVVVALMFFGLGGLFVGLSISFFMIISTGGGNISRVVQGILSYTTAPIGILSAMYLGFNIFKPALTKKIVIIYLLTGIVFLIALYGFSDVMIGGVEPAPLEMRDISLKSVCLGLIMFFILSNLILLGGGFFHLRRNLAPSPERKQVTLLLYGFVLFSIGAIIDTLIPLEYIVIARVIMVVSFVMVFKGYSHTK